LVDKYQKKMWKTRIKSFPTLYLLANSLSWFTITLFIIEDFVKTLALNELFLVSGFYFAGLIGSAVIGATLLNGRSKNKTFLFSWILFGVVACLLFSLGATTSLTGLTAALLILGASIGLGIPTCFSFFADQTKAENRGRIGALMFFIVQLFAAILIFSTDGVAINYQFLILAIWRLLGVVGIFFYKPLPKMSEERVILIKSIVKERTFLLYFLPWFLFTLVNFTESPIIQTYFGPVLYNNSLLVETLINSVAAFIGGALCDYKGRKITAILGFVLLGLGYAILSFFNSGSYKEIAQFLYIVCDGVAWGILYVTFIFVLWGDLSDGKTREKYYLLGSLPFLFSGMIEMLVQPFVKSDVISTAFSLASFFLFIAIVPLLYATETLPEKAMKDRDLKSYLEKAQKIAQKETEKKQKKESTNTSEDSEESEVEQEENDEKYVEAQKLAEKYY